MPGFLAYLAGTTVREGASKRWDIFAASILFVAGFSVVFSLLGVLLNTILTSVAYDVQLWLSRAGGLVIIFFGLYLTGLIRLGWLEKEYKFSVTGKRSKHVTSFLFGVAFAAGWTPCVGAALGAILGLAASQPGIAFTLLLAYSLGLGLPFIVTGLFASRVAPAISKYSRVLQVHQRRVWHCTHRPWNTDLHADAGAYRGPAPAQQFPSGEFIVWKKGRLHW